MKSFRYISLSFALVVSLSGLLTLNAEARPAYARKEKKACNYCHSVAQGGGPRGFRGMYYQGHNLSFEGFKEEVEAKKAGVKPNSTGPASKPTKPYTGKK